MTKALTKRLILFVLVSLIMSSFSGIFDNQPNREISLENIDQSIITNPLLRGNSEDDGLKSKYVIFASNQEQLLGWKNRFDVVTEYHNLMALEVLLTNYEYYEIIKISDSKPQPSKLLRSSIESSLQINSNNQISLNAIEDADILNVSDLWNLGYNGTGVVVAVFDNGINFSHEALLGQNYSAPVLFNDIDGTTKTPCMQHGTPVAGLIASTGTGAYATTLGTAFGSKIVDMQMGCSGGNLHGDPIAGFDWLAGQNDTIKVVNLSWGAGTGIVFDEIINRLAQLGIVVVVSAGNVENVSLQDDEFMVLDPATALGSIAVGAVDHSLVPTGFSALGPNLKYITKPDIVAPGQGLTTLSAAGGLTSFTGTSGSAPLVSGAIATLISGLEDQNLAWNVGTIKAALMRSSTALPYEDLKVGQGLVNLNTTWDYLINAPKDDRGPKVLEITPSSGPFHLYDKFPRNSIGYVPISLISSHPDLVNIEIMGNLSQIISLDTALNNDYSQIVYLETNSTGVAEGWYTGFINASIGNDFVVSEFSISIVGVPSQKILLDLRHTNWDLKNEDNIGGQNTGEMIELAQSKDMWVHEVNVELTYEVLKAYDIVWLPDPLDFTDGQYNNPDPLLPSEINALQEFVTSGGSLLIDFIGSTSNQEFISGTNTTELNLLLTNFDIEASTIPMEDLSGTTAKLTNVTSLVGEATKITHFGNYLNTGPNAQKIAADEFGVTLASYQNENGGKVLVSSTNFWLDNAGVNGLYNDFGDEGDKILSNNLWDWFSNNDTINIVSDDRSGSIISIKFNVNTDDLNSNPELNVTWSQIDNTKQNVISVSNITNLLSFEIDFQSEGSYEIFIQYGAEYQRLFFTVDTKPPEIQSLQINQTGYDYGVPKTFSFQIQDEQSNLTLLNMKVYLDGLELNNLVYSKFTSILDIEISGSLMTSTNHWYTLQIEVIDDFMNKSSIFYVFYVGAKPTTIYSETSIIISTSESSVDSYPAKRSKDNGSSGFIKLSMSLISLSLITLVIAYRRGKRSD